ncbi:MAG: glycosyltransferase [Leptospiraceae bacterium]|jgi:glycosyltransferase involved in cell wall biosynthesis|nr:glycosyltransferase [Leptospiraceae bacterium]MCZ8347440.1 glycosyltransferase [Leptospiraceae bacterium]PJE00017.1 MAG: glycosyl transferase family 2 [Leptospira sp.]
MPKISVIIPTLNEEELLPTLLECLKQQTFRDFEIIVADAGSKDQTRKIAKKYGALVVDGGMPGVGRNKGAEVAKGEFLFFFDADVLLPNDFLAKAYGEIEDKFVDLATCEFKPQSDLRLDKVLFQLSNLFVKINQKLNPRAAGFCIFISSRLFRRIKGFDESVKLAEDHDLVERASKYRSLHFINSTHLMVSIRRLEKEGRFSLIEKYMQVELHLLTKGSIRREDFVNYEFANFNPKKDNKEDKKFLDELEKRIIQMEEGYNKLTEGNIIADQKEKLEKNLDNIKDMFQSLFKFGK